MACYDCGRRLVSPRASFGVAADGGPGVYDWTIQRDGGDVKVTQSGPKPPDTYVPALLALVDALVASGVPVKLVRCGFLLISECRDRVGARVEPGASGFERNGIKWDYDGDCGAYGIAIV